MHMQVHSRSGENRCFDWACSRATISDRQTPPETCVSDSGVVQCDTSDGKGRTSGESSDEYTASKSKERPKKMRKKKCKVSEPKDMCTISDVIRLLGLREMNTRHLPCAKERKNSELHQLDEESRYRVVRFAQVACTAICELIMPSCAGNLLDAAAGGNLSHAVKSLTTEVLKNLLQKYCQLYRKTSLQGWAIQAVVCGALAWPGEIQEEFNL